MHLQDTSCCHFDYQTENSEEGSASIGDTKESNELYAQRNVLLKENNNSIAATQFCTVILSMCLLCSEVIET